MIASYRKSPKQSERNEITDAPENQVLQLCHQGVTGHSKVRVDGNMTVQFTHYISCTLLVRVCAFIFICGPISMYTRCMWQRIQPLEVGWWHHKRCPRRTRSIQLWQPLYAGQSRFAIQYDTSFLIFIRFCVMLVLYIKKYYIILYSSAGWLCDCLIHSFKNLMFSAVAFR